MATLSQLQAISSDVAASLSSVAATRARLAAKRAALPAGADIERRLIDGLLGHLLHQAKVLSARRTMLLAEITRVQGGGTSTLPVPTTSAELNGMSTVMPVRDRRLAA